MPIPARIVRAFVQSIDRNPPELTERERARRQRILILAPSVFVRFGRRNLTFAIMASALEMGTAALRRHFCDLESLMATIINRHLQEIATAMGAVHADAPNAQHSRRAAYIRATRTALGGFTEAHALLVYERHNLPDDERVPIEATRQQLGILLAGDMMDEAYLLLDAPFLEPQRIENMFAGAAHPQSSAETLPEQYAAPPKPPPPQKRKPTQKPWIRRSIVIPALTRLERSG